MLPLFFFIYQSLLFSIICFLVLSSEANRSQSHQQHGAAGVSDTTSSAESPPISSTVSTTVLELVAEAGVYETKLNDNMQLSLTTGVTMLDMVAHILPCWTWSLGRVRHHILLQYFLLVRMHNSKQLPQLPVSIIHPSIQPATLVPSTTQDNTVVVIEACLHCTASTAEVDIPEKDEKCGELWLPCLRR